MVYRDGKAGTYFYKRFNVTSITHDREYDLTLGTPGSRVVYFTANPNGEAEVIKIALKPSPKIKKLSFECDFGELQIKGRQSRGNTLTKNDVYRITLKSHGVSTLGGCKIWFDKDVNRLNIDGCGDYIGEFHGSDRILVVLEDGSFYTTDFDLSNHYEPGIIRMEKYDEAKVWTALLFDSSQNDFLYLKRFNFERASKKQNFLGEDAKSRLVCLSSDEYSRFRITLGGPDSFREPIEIEASEFVGVKSFKARGKRVTTFNVEAVEQIPSLLKPQEAPETESAESIEEGEEEEKEPTLFE